MTAALLFLALAATQADPANLCTLCHPDIRVQFERSIHRVEDVTCVSCHGGNPEASTVAAAHSGDFKGPIARARVPALCASCHADSARMRPYDLSSDQYALYQTSQHGIKLARGDDKVAVCTDCHGVHEILRTDDPASSVFYTNIPNTCGRCHSDAKLMAGYGKTTDPKEDYLSGVHGEALTRHGNSESPECTRCHGAHGATPPGVGDVGKVCGQCHASTRTHFLEGPHRAALRDAGLPECASCHGDHRITRADVGMLDTICVKCHAQDSPPAALAARMKTLYVSAAEEVEKAGALVDRAAAVPLYIEDYKARLEEARTSLIESLPLMHSLDLQRVESLTVRARSIGSEVESEVTGKLSGRGWRHVGLLIFWFYLIITIAVLVRWRAGSAKESSS